MVDLGAEHAIAAEDFAGMFKADLGAVEQAMGFGQAVDGLGREIVSFQSDDVDASGSGRIAFGQHIRRHVVANRAESGDKGIAADGSEVMHGDAAAEGDMVVQVDMAAERMGEGGWEWLAYLPEEVRLDVCGRTVYMTHAAPGEVTEKLLPGTPDVRYQELAAEVNADLVVVGHTHIPMVKKVSGTLFVNPGSVGRPRDGPEASYAVVDFPSLDVRAYRVAYDSAAAAEEVAAMGMEDLASALAEGRNSDSQGAVGRWASGLSPDWAHVEQVRTLAMLLFDHTRGLHRLGGRERELLELAALAHDVGLSQGAEGHQRRALDLVMGADLPLDRKAKMMVACVARYHGCRPPRDGDRVFKDLRKREREVVRRLASLLALADALDRGHGSAVSGLKVKAGKKELRLKLLGRGPFALEREWGGYKAVQFERTFGRRVRFDD